MESLNLISKAEKIIADVQDFYGSGKVEDAFSQLMDIIKNLSWQDIETAPKDGTVVDLLIDGDERHTNMVWGIPERVWDCDNHCEFPYKGTGCWLNLYHQDIVDSVDIDLEYTHWKHIS